MKYLKFITCLYILTTILSCSDTNTSNSQNQENVSQAERLPKILDEIDHALIISYTSAFDEEQTFSDYISKNFSALSDVNVLNDEKLHIKERVKINNSDLPELFKILYQEPCTDDLVGNCFTPNHAFIYYNQSGKAIGYTEICFDCITAVSSENIPEFKLCNSKLNLLMEFMKKHNIHYFEHVL